MKKLKLQELIDIINSHEKVEIEITPNNYIIFHEGKIIDDNIDYLIDEIHNRNINDIELCDFISSSLKKDHYNQCSAFKIIGYNEYHIKSLINLLKIIRISKEKKIKKLFTKLQ
jgi:uncharacterized membrane protein